MATATAEKQSPHDTIRAEHEELEELREWRDRIEEAEAAVAAAESEYEDAKQTAASCKKILDGKIVALRNIIKASEEEYPLFDQPAEWEKVPIVDALDLTDRQAEKLLDGGITTVGQFEKLRSGKGLDSLEGVGKATAEKWEEEMLAWLSEHRDKQVLSEAAQGGEPGEPPADDDEPRRIDEE